MRFGQLLHVTPGPVKRSGFALGPYRHPAEVDRATVEVVSEPPSSHGLVESDELAPVVRAFKGSFTGPLGWGPLLPLP